MEGKTVKESVSEYLELALPNDANAHGNVLGGKVMHLVDLAAAMAAMRHGRRAVVTASRKGAPQRRQCPRQCPGRKSDAPGRSRGGHGRHGPRGGGGGYRLRR